MTATDVIGVDAAVKETRHRRETVYDDEYPHDLPKLRCPDCNWPVAYANILDGILQVRCNNCRHVIRFEFGLEAIR